MRPGGENLGPALGVLAGIALAVGAGALIGPMASHTTLHGAVAGALVAASIAGGSLVSDAVGHDLAQSQSDTTLGRAAFLDRTLPVIYAAPVFYHYLRSVSP